ncbi:hypothetical protein PUR71_32235 [Streptomyces sp. SP17BM10]|uniref:hypothetical protein n=1 Tax=Streptomyces sp. SP17BM10 TaxID=3002530 RepID=UPI002E76E468|nr:hypothetical protein [Streptomyces sp. SP17BM10]MEE1787540.1 hypothetical protein [Streptomyces sp. SP17BM10]
MSDISDVRDVPAGPDGPPAAAGDDQLLARIALGLDGVQAAQRGRTAEARASFEALWAALGERGDVFHRCVLAHYLADLQDDPRAELEWDRRALAAADSLTAERAQTYESALQVRAFYPSLHLNLASDHLKLGEADLAREQLERAVRSLDALPEDAYSAGIRAAVDELRQRLR